MKKIELNSNAIRIIAIVFVLIDHVGVYFESSMPHQLYIVLRTLGRIAMPIFAFLIVQGFFYTKDLTKYVKRVFITGVITQIILFTLYTLNKFVFIDYAVNKAVLNINIIISFAICLIIIKVLDEIINLKSKNMKLNKSIVLLAVISLIMIVSYAFIEYDYSYQLVVYVLMLYFIQKIFIERKISKKIYNILQIIAILIFIMLCNSFVESFAILSLPIILLYNGERGKKSKTLNILFYTMYPLQHAALYLLAIILS